MSDDEIKELSQTMSTLGTVNSSIIERLIVEFADQIAATGSLMRHVHFVSTERLLGEFLDKGTIANIIEDIHRPRQLHDVRTSSATSTRRSRRFTSRTSIRRPWRSCSPKIRADQLPRACWYLAPFAEDFAMEVVMRMLHMETDTKEVLDDVEARYAQQFMSRPAAKTSRKDTLKLMAEIFFARPGKTGRYDTLEERNRDSRRSRR